jgi:hypothetical protein
LAAHVDENVTNDMAVDDVAVDDMAATWQMTWQQGRCPGGHMALTWYPHGVDMAA